MGETALEALKRRRMEAMERQRKKVQPLTKSGPAKVIPPSPGLAREKKLAKEERELGSPVPGESIPSIDHQVTEGEMIWHEMGVTLSCELVILDDPIDPENFAWVGAERVNTFGKPLYLKKFRKGGRPRR